MAALGALGQRILHYEAVSSFRTQVWILTLNRLPAAVPQLSSEAELLKLARKETSQMLQALGFGRSGFCLKIRRFSLTDLVFLFVSFLSLRPGYQSLGHWGVYHEERRDLPFIM